MKTNLTLWMSLMIGILCLNSNPAYADIRLEKDKITLTYADKEGEYTIKRAPGRYSDYLTIATTTDASYEDKTATGSPYQYYYLILNEQGDTVKSLSAEQELFGDDVHIYGPSDSPEKIAEDIAAIHREMFRAEMGRGRYALMFKPGDYTQAGLFNIGFYTHVGGLGKTPYEVKISNVHTPPHLNNDNGTCTFWRSIENMSVVGPESYDHDDMFNWAVSQAAPFRRMYSQRTVRNQWKNGWVSGGFTADCVFEAPVGSDGQQQWFTRNSFLNKGRGKFAEGAYNFVFTGVELGDDAAKDTYIDSDWDKGGNVTFVPATPGVSEKPFLFLGEDGRYKVFRPAVRRESKGVSYTKTDMGEGEVIDLLDSFLVAKPSTSAAEMNEALASGKHLMLTPGIYELEAPLEVTVPNTIVMGLGWATIVPPDGADYAIKVDDIDGVRLASLLFDAHHSSHNLLKIGDKKSDKRHIDNPIVLSDMFFRVGGFLPQKVHVDVALEINSNDVIGDHFWIWRADHGVKNSVGWDVNTADYGLVVNGDNATIYGLFNEHFQKYQTLWNGEDGLVYFYQCETPYDAPVQEAFLSEGGTRDGYATYKVADNVQRHRAYGLGIYDVLHNDIRLENSVEVPYNPGIEIHHLVNTSFIPGPKKGFGYVINGLVESTYLYPKQHVARLNHFSGSTLPNSGN